MNKLWIKSEIKSLTILFPYLLFVYRFATGVQGVGYRALRPVIMVQGRVSSAFLGKKHGWNDDENLLEYLPCRYFCCRAY